MTDGLLRFLSAVFGWTYFICWSLSFYPQSILNYTRKSTSGSHVDFPLLNCLGFFAYLASNMAFYYSSLIRAQYGARHSDLTPTVHFNDITFAANGLIMSFVVTSQYFFPRVWGFTPSVGNRPSRFNLGIFLGCILGPAIIIFVVLGSPDRNSVTAAGSWLWLDSIYAVSYAKMVVTFIKYIPQVYFNYRNKSTVGWSIHQILLDFSGSFLSIAQQGIDSYIQKDWSGITGNPVKFSLGNISILYNAIFLVQHFFLYRHAGSKAEDASLLRSTDEEDRID